MFRGCLFEALRTGKLFGYFINEGYSGSDLFCRICVFYLGIMVGRM